MQLNTRGKRIAGFLGIYCLVFVLSACTDKKQDTVFINTQEKLIVQCKPDCNSVSKKVSALGGTVEHEFQNITALEVSLPISNVSALESFAGVNGLRKINIIPRPIISSSRSLQASGLINAPHLPLNIADKIDSNIVSPTNYIYNNISNGVANLHLQDITGKGVIVAIIDSGTANNSEVVPALAGSVIGGESFINLPDEPSATSTLNDDHGTMVGSMIAAHLALIIPNDAPIIQSLQIHAPQSVFPYDADTSLFPMLGTAPDASLYALKVFAANNEGTPDSIVLAAMDRALTLKKNYNLGMPSDPVSGDGSEDNPFVYDSLNIQVVNLSLGGMTMFPGNSIEDLLVLEMLEHGIAVVTSAGNSGFGALTGGGPGTSAGSINVGAANSPVHERILRDLQDVVGAGIAFRPNNIMQTAFFSSRGPTADGRIGIDLVANGFASLTQAADGAMTFVSGTSFSAPTVAGAAALLWSATTPAIIGREISASQIREALLQSANPNMLGNPGDQAIDRGLGFLDAEAALTHLSSSGEVEIPEPPKAEDEPSDVLDNIKDLNLNIVDLSNADSFSIDINLNPGEAINFLVPTQLNTQQITVKMLDIRAELPLQQQNVLFGDAFFLQVLDAPTSIDDILLDERLVAGDPDGEYTLSQPQSGLLRVAALGDWTNAGKVQARLEISARYRKLPSVLFDGSIRDDRTDTYRINVEVGTSQLDFELSWGADWASYPPHDIDLILIDPDGNYVFDAATLAIPERLHIDNPAPGRWDVVVAGYMMHGLKDEYELRITDQDGESLED